MEKGLERILLDFEDGFKILDDYDHERFDKQIQYKLEDIAVGYILEPAIDKENTVRKAVIIKYDEFRQVFNKISWHYDTAVFENEMDMSFSSSIDQIYQSVDNQDEYPSLEEKAGMLLYLTTNDHSFSDGNKRIGAALFLYFLDRNNFLYQPNGSTIITPLTLAAITLSIAENNIRYMKDVISLIVEILIKGRFEIEELKIP